MNWMPPPSSSRVASSSRHGVGRSSGVTPTTPSREEMQRLMASFDEIPRIMKAVRHPVDPNLPSPQKTTRYGVLGPNHSFGAEFALRGHQHIDPHDVSYSNRVNHMATQADRVLEHLSQLPTEQLARGYQTSDASVVSRRTPSSGSAQGGRFSNAVLDSLSGTRRHSHDIRRANLIADMREAENSQESNSRKTAAIPSGSYAKEATRRRKQGSTHPTHVSHDVRENARRATRKLSQLTDSGIDLEKLYRQYDIHRSGRISYKDFCDSLVLVSSGVGRDDAMTLAAQLDPSKSGTINYRSILSTLRNVEKTGAPPSTPSTPKLNRNASSGTFSSIVASVSRRGGYDGDASTLLDDRIMDSLPPPPPPPLTLITSPTPMEHSGDGYYAEYLRKSGATTPHATPTAPYIEKVQTLSPNGRSVNVVATCSEGPSTNWRQLEESREKKNPRINLRAKYESRIPPYYVDPTAEEEADAQLVKRQMAPRPSSAPVRRSGEQKSSLARYLDTRENSDPKSPISRRGPTECDPSISLKMDLEQRLKRSEAPVSTTQDEAQRAEYFFMRRREEALRQVEKAREIEIRTAENAVVSQLGGRSNVLRHLMKQLDPSRSGVVNFTEFKTGLSRAGIQLTANQMKALFNSCASELNVRNETPLLQSTNGEAVSIESFVDRITARTTAPALASVTANMRNSRGEDVREAARASTDSRVFRKVLHCLNQSTDMHRLFSHINPRHGGKLTVDEFRESLSLAGANLTDMEMDTVIRHVGQTSHDRNGKIVVPISNIDSVLNRAVMTVERDEEKSKKERLRDAPRYSNTYSSSVVFGIDVDHINSSENASVGDKIGQGVSGSLEFASPYDQVTKSQSHRRERQHWEKLRDLLQNNYSQALQAFIESPNTTSNNRAPPPLQIRPSSTGAIEVPASSLQTIAPDELQRRLRSVGLPLGADDVARLTNAVKQHQTDSVPISTSRSNIDSKDDRVSIEQFCDVVGIPVTYEPKRETIRIINAKDEAITDNIFQSSQRSIAANPTYSASGLISPQRSLHSLRNQANLSSDPSKFWEFKDSVTNPMAFAYPMQNFRSEAPTSNGRTSTRSASPMSLRAATGSRPDWKLSLDDTSIPTTRGRSRSLKDYNIQPRSQSTPAIRPTFETLSPSQSSAHRWTTTSQSSTSGTYSRPVSPHPAGLATTRRQREIGSRGAPFATDFY